MADTTNKPDSTENQTQPVASPNPLMTEPELVELDSALTPHPPKGRRAAATFIFFTVTLDMLALGMIAPVLPRLIEGFLHGDTSSAAKMLGLFGTVFAAMQFFFSPILGSLSDRFGRRPVVLLSNFGLGLDYLLMAWAPALSWLFLGRVISGLTASSIPTAMAYMADVTPRERRAAAFGMLNAAFGAGFILGPAIGGLLGNINPRLPFWAAGGLSLVNGLYGLFVLPESLSLQNRCPFSWAPRQPRRLSLASPPPRRHDHHRHRSPARLHRPAGPDERLRHLCRLPLPFGPTALSVSPSRSSESAPSSTARFSSNP